MILITKNTRQNFQYLIFHVLIGLSAYFTKWAFIFWIYFILFYSINIINSEIKFKKTIINFLPIIVYICSFDVFSRALKAYPYIPWEVSKYFLIASSLIIISTGVIKKTYKISFFLIILLIPAIIFDKSGLVSISEVIYNVFGLLSMFLFIAILGNYKIKDFELNHLLRLIWLPSVSLLTYVIFSTPKYSDISFDLSAQFNTSGGFGSNQVSSILGAGLFLIFYSWMNKLAFSGYHLLDGLLIGLFAFQGWLTFSRGGMIVGCFCSILYFIFFISSKDYSKIVSSRKLKPFFFFSIFVISIFISFSLIKSITGGVIQDRFLGHTNSTLSGEKIRDFNTITTGRYNILLDDIKLWNDNFFLGTGVGASKYLRNNLSNINIASHTEISRLIAEHGLLGLIIIIIIIIAYYYNYKQQQKNIYSALLIVLFIFGVGTSLHSGMRTFITPIMIGLSFIKIVQENKSDNKIKNDI